MCTACDEFETVLAPSRRLKLWEITSGSHCSILGTCLPLSDLRALARKCSLRVKSDLPLDYQYHGYFVKQASKQERPAKFLNKLLDKRHAAAIRKARDAKSVEDLEALWQAAQEAGNIPGMYWAILSHPIASRSLRDRMFSDVHMISHLVGASNRADIRRLSTLEEKVAALEEKLSKQHRRNHLKLCEKNNEIRQLRAKLCVKSQQAKRSEEPQQIDVSAQFVPSDLTDELDQLETKLARYSSTVQENVKEIVRLTNLEASLRDENQSLELALLRQNNGADIPCPFDLEGRCLLYVGGRQRTVHHLRVLVEEWNGQLLHHDGGIERSIAGLAREISKADAVVFPTDCVSHSAVLKLKRLCHQSMKPFVPLRSTGIASFISGLRNSVQMGEQVQPTALPAVG